MAIDLDDWLRALGMERYVTAFHDHDVDGSLLPTITAEDLRDMGIASVGHRRQLLNAIALLRSGQASDLANGPFAEKADRSHSVAPQQRRQLSVVFTDLVGSTQLSEQLDAEELSTLLTSYKSAVTEIVEEYGGFVAQYLGDGVLAYFGWPQAYDHDAERAVRSGLSIADSMHFLGRPHGVKLNCRIGIATGNVVVGDLIRNSYIEEDQAVGRAPNLAARIQLMAKPGTLAISDETKKIVEGKFDLTDLGNHKLKGFRGEVRIWRVEGATDGPTPDFKRRSKEKLPIINRKVELGQLDSAWEQVEQGFPRSMLISGEPGIGKSRLVEEFVSHVLEAEGDVLRFQCSPFHTNDALYPVLNQIWSMVLGGGQLSARDTAQRLEQIFSATTLDPGKAASLADALMQFREHGRDTTLPLDALGRKEMTFQALIALFEWYVRDKKVLVVFEDLHWIDPTTKELLGRLLETFKDEQVMVLLTCRPAFQTAWEVNTRIELTRLSNEEIGEIAAHVYDLKPVPMPVLELIADRSDGVPLFAEELSKSFIETGVFDRTDGGGTSIDETAVPTTLNELLVARLDRHPESRRILQTAAAIGRDFSFDVLSAVIDESDHALSAHLNTLVSAQIIVPTPAAVRRYSFRHALMRDAAYETMLRSVRAMVHARIAAVLGARFRKITPAHVLGSHWGLSGNHAEATRCFQQAAEQASSRYANTEATAYFKSALNHLEQVTLSDGLHPGTLPERADLLEQLGTVLTLVHDLDGAVAAYREAVGLVQDNPRKTARLHRLTGNALQQDRAGSLAELAAAEAALDQTAWRDDAELLREWIDIQLNTLNVHYWSGDGEAMSQLAAGLAQDVGSMTAEQRAEYFDQLVLRDLRMSRYDPTEDTIATASNYVSAAEETGNLAIVASALFILGFVNLHSIRLPQAQEAMSAGLEAARKSGHRKIELRCMTYLSLVYRRMHNPSEATRLSHESIALARELQMHEYIALATANLSWEAWQRSADSTACKLAREAMVQFEKTSIAYPFEWSALLPLIASGQTQKDLSEVPNLCARLLDSSQQNLTETLRNVVADIATLTGTDDVPLIKQRIAALIDAARYSGFL